jgi:DNA polymerase-3 subunit delta
MPAKSSNKFQDYYSQVQIDCQSKQFAPIYLLQGDETFFITSIVNYLEKNVLSESEKAFNQHIFYGRDIDAMQLLGAVKRFPMMAEKQLVIVKEAQNLKGLSDLLHYFENPLNSTVLVMCFMGKKVNASTKEGKVLKKYAVFSADTVPEWQIDNWILSHCKTLGLELAPKDAHLMFEFLGNNLSKIDGELHKLAVNIAPKTKVTPADIEAYVGISREYNVFELQKALGQKDFSRANKILKYFMNDTGNNPFVLTLANMFSFFQKVMNIHYAPRGSEQQMAASIGVSPYFIKDYQIAQKNYSIIKLKNVFDVLHQLDLKYKGVGTRKPADAELYKELIVKLMR